MFRKMFAVLLLLSVLTLALAACKKAAPVTETAVETYEPVQESVEVEPEPKTPQISVKKIIDKATNPLTGLLIDIKDYEKRPYAVMINNMHLALPQSGIGNADIIYEILAEGGITRMLAVFHEYNSEKIGPVRSARHYYLDFAFDNDAIYVHHGGSPQGYSAISKLNVDNLDGMKLDGTAFQRDPERVKIPKMYEHSSYTSSENIYDTSEKYGYRVESLEDFPYMFSFYNVHTANGEKHEDTLEMPFSSSQVSNFAYNAETKLYERSQNGEPHIDKETGEQLQVSNVIVQYASVYVISGDSEGRRNAELVGSGNGVLYTGGTKQEITWSKESHQKPTVWKDSDGNRLKLNKGKTWICVMDG